MLLVHWLCVAENTKNWRKMISVKPKPSSRARKHFREKKNLFLEMFVFEYFSPNDLIRTLSDFSCFLCGTIGSFDFSFLTLQLFRHHSWRSDWRQQRNKEQEKEVLDWIYAVLGEPVPAGDYENILRDGIVLCKLANKLTPGCIKKIQERGTNFQLMENVQRLCRASKKTLKMSLNNLFLDSKPLSRSTESQKKKFSKLLIYSSVATSPRSPCASTLWEESPKSIPNILDHRLDPKWPRRMSEHSPKNSCGLTKENSTISVPDTTREPARPDMAVWETLVTCKKRSQKPANHINSNYLITWNFLLLLNYFERLNLNLQNCWKFRNTDEVINWESSYTMRLTTFQTPSLTHKHTQNTLRCELVGDLKASFSLSTSF